VIAGAQLAPSLARRFDDTVIMAAGLGVSAVGFALLTQVDAHSLPLLVASYFTMSLGVGPLTAICPGLIVGTAPPERAGAAASLSSTSAEFGGALGLAMLGSLGVAVYRVALAMPPGLSAGAAASTHDSLGTALQASTHLPPVAGAGVVAAARDAFTTAFVVVAAVCAVLVVMMVVALIASHRSARRMTTVDIREPDVRPAVSVASHGRSG
jgi:DHA2 family multidrug resistance protein-like MFS transporter